MWVFLFFFFFPFQAYQSSVFVTCVKASYMFNKANYLVKNIQAGIILSAMGGKCATGTFKTCSLALRQLPVNNKSLV